MYWIYIIFVMIHFWLFMNACYNWNETDYGKPPSVFLVIIASIFFPITWSLVFIDSFMKDN